MRIVYKKTILDELLSACKNRLSDVEKVILTQDEYKALLYDFRIQEKPELKKRVEDKKLWGFEIVVED